MMRIMLDGKPTTAREITITVELDSTEGPHQHAQIKVNDEGVTMDTVVISGDGDQVVASQSRLWDEFDIGAD